jgi:DNA-binding transcriptional ArsR family regulator
MVRRRAHVRCGQQQTGRPRTGRRAHPHPPVLGWPDLAANLHTSSQTALRYPARAAATVRELPESGNGAVAELIGKPRARLLGLLRSPATTTALARSLGVSPAAISQHLTALHRAGLLDPARSGHAVFYQASNLGQALLDADTDHRQAAH